MKMYSDFEEKVIYYERGAHIYQLVKCREEDETEFYV